MTYYLHIALWLVFFYDSLIMLALPSTVTFSAGLDGSAARFICYLMAVVITGHVLARHGFNKLPITSFGFLLVFIVFSALHTTNIHFDTTFIPQDSGLFNFKPMFECFLYFGLFMAVFSMPIDEKNLNLIYKALAVSGIIISVYIAFQRMGIDQIYRLTDEMSIDHLTRNPQAGGFISQPIFAGALLVMLSPFMVRMRAWLGLVALAGIILTGNRGSLVAIGFFIIFLCTRNKVFVLKAFVAYMVILAIAVAIVAVFPGHIEQYIQSSGRLFEWKAMVLDFINPAFPGIDKTYILTGQGIGAFSIFYPFYNHSGFYQAHNEYLELFRGVSFIGMFFFFKGQFQALRSISNQFIFLSLMGISVIACTTPVWHNPTLAFLTAFLAGLGLNLSHQNKAKEIK